MMKTALISNPHSGLNIYVPKELSTWIAHCAYRAEMVEMEDKSRCLRLFPSTKGRARFTPHGNSNERLRIQMKSNTVTREISSLGPFGATEVTWTRGEDTGELYFSIPAPDAMNAPRRTAKRGARSLSAAGPAVSPHARLKTLMLELNAIMALGELGDVTISFVTGNGTLTPINFPIKGRRTEEFG